MTLEQLRNEFPQLNEKVYGKQLVYLDNAATSMRPRSVIDEWTEMSFKWNSNLHRAVHHTADVATGRYEEARSAVAAFIGAGSSDEVVFTSGATASLNLVASSFGQKFVSEGDEIVVCESEHHSDIVPWQMLCARKNAKLVVLHVDENGEVDLTSLPSLLNDRTRLVCVAHISNVLGVVNPVSEIVSICHSKNIPVLVDGAQGIVHSKVDVASMDCDFYCFSGHKIYAAPGTGVLYAKKKWLDAMPPYMGGGEMIDTVKWSGTTYADAPHKFEAGTQNISGVPTWIPALKLAESMRCPEIEENQNGIVDYLLDELPRIEGLRLYGVPSDRSLKIPLFSFTVKGVHHEDIALLLDKMGVAVRSGHMCAEPLMDRFGTTGMVRASFAPYNTLDEARFFVQSLKRAVEMLVR